MTKCPYHDACVHYGCPELCPCFCDSDDITLSLIHISQLAMSAMDDWGSEVKEPSGPALVIIEGLTMYLTQADVQRIFAVIAGRFPAATVFTETMNPMVVKRFKEKSIEGSKAKFT